MLLPSLLGTSSTFEQLLEELGKIAVQIHQGDTVDAVLNCGVREARMLFGSDRVIVYHLLPPDDGVVLAESVSRECSPIIGQLIYDPCFQDQWREVYRQGQTNAIADVERSGLDACYVGLLAQLQVKAYLVAPILLSASPQSVDAIDAQLWGLLIVHQCSAPRVWEDYHGYVLKYIATQMGLALQHLDSRHCLECQRSSDQLWLTVLEEAEDGVWDWDVSTNGVFFSQKWKAMLGYADHEVGESFSEWESRLHPADRAVVLAQLTQHLTPQTPSYRLEYRLLTKDDTWKWVLSQGRVMRWSVSGQPLRVVGTYTDISDRKRMEADLRASQKKYQTLFQVLPIGISLTDDQGNLVEVNPAAESVLRVTTAEHLYRSLHSARWTILRPDGSRMPLEEYAAVRALREHRLIQMDMGLVDDDGTVRWIKVSAAPIPLEGYGVVIAYSDITTLKRAEQQLQVQTAALNACADVVMITDRHGKIEWVNPAFVTLTGYSQAEALGKNPRALVKSGVQSDQFYQQLWRTISAGQVWRGELVNRRKDGSLYTEEMTITPVHNPQGEIVNFIAIKQDVTERHQMEQRLRDRNEMLRKISEQVPGVVYQYRLYPDGRACFPYASEAIRQIYEVTPAQAQQDAQVVLKRLHPEDADRVAVGIWRSSTTLTLWHDDYRVVLPERGLRWVEGHAMPERLSDGSVLWHGYIWDITDRKLTEALLHHELQRERMVYLIDHHMRESLDLETILQTTVEEVRQFLATDRVLIYRLHEDWSGVVMAESVADGWLAIQSQTITDAYFVETQGKSYLDNRIKAVTDIYAVGLSSCHINMLEALQVRAKLIVPILQGDHLWGLLIAHHCQSPREWQPSESRLLKQLAGQLAIAIQHAVLLQRLQEANQELERLSNTDALTQIANRRRFDYILTQEWRRSHREQTPLALVLCDIDYFKQYNDTNGHPMGDACLIAVAHSLQQCLKRPGDCLARYGGEEFAVILPQTTLAGALEVVRTMQTAIATLDIPHTTHAFASQVTLSFGITAMEPALLLSPEVLLNQADQALYQAKAAGRNRYAVITQTP